MLSLEPPPPPPFPAAPPSAAFRLRLSSRGNTPRLAEQTRRYLLKHPDAGWADVPDLPKAAFELLSRDFVKMHVAGGAVPALGGRRDVEAAAGAAGRPAGGGRHHALRHHR